MTALTSSPALQQGIRQAPSAPGYWPHLLIEAVPWLLLGAVLRLNILSAPGPIAIVLFPLIQFAIFIAFLVACERAIRLAGGATNLERLALGDQLRLGRSVLGSLLVIVVAAICLGAALGLPGESVGGFLLGFDGIVFNWGTRKLLLAWSPFVAVLTFLMVVEKGAGRRPSAPAALRQLMLRRRHLLPATVAVAAFIAASTYLRLWLGSQLHAVIGPMPDSTLKYGIYLLFFAGFAYGQLWVTVNILTHALRSSYRGGQADSPGAA